MNGIKGRLFLSYLSVWVIWNFPWIVSIFYMSWASPDQQKIFIGQSIVLWLMGLILPMLYIMPQVIRIERAAHRIENGETLSEKELKGNVRITDNLPLHSFFLFLATWLSGIIVLYYLWGMFDLGIISRLSIWVGGIAGFLAVSPGIFGFFSLNLSRPLNIFTTEAESRGIDVTRRIIGIRLKLAFSFMLFALGFAWWLGGMGFYTGVNQIIIESSRSELSRITVLAEKYSDFDGSDEMMATLKGDLSRLPAGEEGFAFLVDSKGSMIYRSGGDAALETGVWKDVDKSIEALLSGGEAGTVYENVNEKVITVHPLGAGISLGTVFYIKEKIHSLNSFWGWLGVFLLAGFMTAGVLSYSFSTGNYRSVISLNRMVSEIGKENGQVDLSVRGGVESLDEIGILAININRFSSRLSQMIHKIIEVAGSLSHSLSDLSSTGQNFTIGAQNQAASVEEASASMEEMASSAQAVTDRILMQSASIQQVKKSIDELGVSINHVASRAQMVRTTSDKSVLQAADAEVSSQVAIESMNRIVYSSEKILRIVQVINEITDRTNLLSLNASIEAARAGDTGRGFTVVAEEISRLAEQSAGATREIETLISETRDNIMDGSEKVKNMDTIIVNMKRASETARELGQEMEVATREQLSVSSDIITVMHEMTEKTQEIATTQTEQSNTMTEMSRNLEEINKVTQINAEGVDGMANSLQSMSELANVLKDATRVFKLPGEA